MHFSLAMTKSYTVCIALDLVDTKRDPTTLMIHWSTLHTYILSKVPL